MIKNCFVWLKIIVLMLCSVVGVGFISGAEIYQFFVRFGKFSYLGVFIFFLLMFFLTNKILKQNQHSQNVLKMNNYTKNMVNNTFLLKFKVKSKLLFFNILMMSSAMFAGLFNLINKLFFNNYILLSILAVLIIFIILFFGISCLQKFDYLVLFLIGFICCYFCFNLSVDNEKAIQTYTYLNNAKYCLLAVLFSVLYVFMNVVQIQPIINENNIHMSNRLRKILSFTFALILTLLLTLFIAFFNNNLYLKNAEMPFLKFFKMKNGFAYIMFVIGLVFALFSSLITSLLGVKNFLNQKLNSNLLSTFGAVVLSCFISLLGFSKFVSVVYPLIGFINFVVYVFL